MSDYMDSATERQEERVENRKPRFDGTVTLGNVFSIVAMVGTILMMWVNMEKRIAIVEERQRVQTQAVDKLVTTVETMVLVQARQVGQAQKNP